MHFKNFSTVKPNDVTSHSYSEQNEDSNVKDHKFKVGDCVGISEYKKIFKIGQRKFLLLVKFKTQFNGLLLLVI